MKKLIPCLLLIALVFTGCSSAKPEDPVKGFFEAAKTFDFDEAKTFVNPDNVSDTDSTLSVSDEDTAFLMDFLKSNNQKIEYTIESAEKADDTGTVTVKCKYVDVSPFLSDYMSELFKQALANFGTEMTDEQYNKTATDLLASKDYSENTKENTFTISCIKKDKTWYIDKVDNNLGNAVLSNMISSGENLANAFSGN